MFRPNRLRRLWAAAGAFTRRDPSLFVFGFALWATCNGASMWMSEDTFSRTPIYSVAKDLGLPDNWVGLGMVVDGLLLAYALGDRAYITRATILWGTGLLWMFWSVIIFMGGIRAGLYSSAGVWTLLCGMILITMSGNRWTAGQR